MTEIIESTIVHPGELTEFPANSNTHPSGNIAELAESRRQFSQYKNAVVWSPPKEMTVTLANGKMAILKPGIRYVLAGNGLHQASLKRRDAEIEVKDYSHLTYEQAVLLAEADNASALGSAIDPAQMKANLERARALYVDNERMAGMLERARKLAGANGVGKVEDVEPQIDRAEELRQRYRVETGQVWELGVHRLVCGDCTDREVVEAAMRGERANNLVTDPPFNVGFNYRTLDFNDNKPLDEYGQWLWSAIALSESFLIEPFMVFMWQAILACRYWAEWIPRNYRLFANLKDFVQFRPTAIQFSWDPVLFWGSGESQIKPVAGKRDYTMSQTSRFVLEESSGHPCPRPIDACIYIIGDLCEPGMVIDPFLGSGTTLIACEQLNRRCRAVEIDPGYVAVALHRWQKLTGLEPRLIT